MKQNKQQIAKMSRTRKLTVLSVSGLLILGLLCLATVFVVDWYRASKRASNMEIKTLIVSAVGGLKVPAPVDEKTGDIYIPQLKVYIPAPQNMVVVTYAYDTSNGQPEVSLSTREAVAGLSGGLYAAPTIDKVFAAVPDLQRCQRGLRLTYDPAQYKEQSDLKDVQQVTLSNGKTLHIFSEGCSQIESVLLPALKTLKPY